MPTKKQTFTAEEIALKGISYVNNKDAIKNLEGTCKELRKPLEAFLDSEGHTLDSGSRLAVITYADKDVHLKQTLRVGKVLLPEAIDVLKDNGLDECVEMVPTIREDVIERLYSEGRISDEIITKLYAEKSTFAFSVDVKEHFDGEEV